MLHLFNKKVDKSLLSHGLSIPTSAVDRLKKVLTVTPSRRASVKVKVRFDDKTYYANINNINFRDSTRELWQILYSINGDLARALSDAFGNSGENQFIAIYEIGRAHV